MCNMLYHIQDNKSLINLVSFSHVICDWDEVEHSSQTRHSVLQQHVASRFIFISAKKSIVEDETRLSHM